MFKDLEALKNQQQKFRAHISEEDDDYLDEDEEFEDDEISYLREKAANQFKIIESVPSAPNNGG